MASFKLLFAVVLAFAAVQCQTKTVKVVSPKADGEVNVGLIVEEVIKIVKVIIAHVDQGIVDAQPSIDTIKNELNPDVAEAIQGLFDNILAIVKNVEDRAQVIIDEVEAALKELEKITSCTDPISSAANDILDKLELDILAVVRQAEKDNQQGLQDINDGVPRIVDAIRALFDKALASLVKCLAPGAQDGFGCVKTLISDTENEILGIGLDALLLLDEIETVVPAFAGQIINGTLPLITNAAAKGDPLLQQVSDCVAKLSS